MSSPATTSTMRAWAYTKLGLPADVLSLTSSLPIPKLTSPSQIRVRITHAAMNPGGTINMFFFPSFLKNFPSVPEMDFAGIVDEVMSPSVMSPSDSDEFKKGDHVFGSIPVPAHLKGSGALAEYVVIDKEYVVHKPDGVQLEDVAGLGVAGCTALGLVNRAKLKRGDRVVVNGASGGIGTIVVQLLRDIVGKEGYIVGTCSPKNFELVKSLGADETIDYNNLSEYSPSESFACCIDCHGSQDCWYNTPKFLSPSGPYVTVGPIFSKYSRSALLYTVIQAANNALRPAWLGGVPRRYVQTSAFSNKKDLTTLKDWVDQGKLRIPRDKIWEFEDVMEGYEIMHSKRARGKIIIKVQDP